MIGLREQLVLLLIARTSASNIRSLVDRLDRADFPASATKSLNILIENDLIRIIGYYHNNPIRYASTENGDIFLKSSIDADKLIKHVKEMSNPGVLLEMVTTSLNSKI